MRDRYKFKDAVVELSDCKNYAKIDGGNYIPVKADGKSPYVNRVIRREGGCVKRVERLRLV